jgi:hypothetical protein
MTLIVLITIGFLACGFLLYVVRKSTGAYRGTRSSKSRLVLYGPTRESHGRCFRDDRYKENEMVNLVQFGRLGFVALAMLGSWRD